MKANKKKIIVLVSMVLLLVATGVLNYFLNVKNNNVTDPDDGALTPTFFEDCRSYRLEVRDLELATLNEIITTSTNTETVAQAEQEKLAMQALMETELILETLIKAKGFDDVVVTISKNKVNVVVPQEGMTIERAVQIHDIIVTETEYTSEDVIITPYYN